MIEYLTNTNLANAKFGRIQGTFGWAGNNAEYAKMWRKKIAEDFANRHLSKFAKKGLRYKIQQCRIADDMARKECR